MCCIFKHKQCFVVNLSVCLCVCAVVGPAMVILLSVCGVATVFLLCLCVCLCKCFICTDGELNSAASLFHKVFQQLNTLYFLSRSTFLKFLLLVWFIPLKNSSAKTTRSCLFSSGFPKAFKEVLGVAAREKIRACYQKYCNSCSESIWRWISFCEKYRHKQKHSGYFSTPRSLPWEENTQLIFTALLFLWPVVLAKFWVPLVIVVIMMKCSYFFWLHKQKASWDFMSPDTPRHPLRPAAAQPEFDW